MNTCGGLGQVSVSCLHSSHSGSRCTTTIVVGPDFNRSVLVAWWKLCLRDTRVNCQHTYDRGGAESQQRVLCETTQQVKGDTTENTDTWIFPAEEYSGTPLPLGALQHWLCRTAIRNAAQKKTLAFILQQLRSRPCPWQGSDKESKKGGLVKHPGQSLVTARTATPPIKAIMANIYWGQRWIGIHTKNSP